MPSRMKSGSAESEGNNNDAAKSSTPGVSDGEVRHESSKAADASLDAQKKAKQLKQAAAGASDPEEREKLMHQAIKAQVEAESFGKTAKYMRSGTFQGMTMGAGVGGGTGIGLGTLTGTLVGGVSSALMGGLGGGVGALTGAIHGPFIDMPKLAAKGFRKVTGKLPSWAASDEQKKALEQMLGDVNETDMPDEGELERFKKDGGGAGMDDDWYQSVKSSMPSLPTRGSAANPEDNDEKAKQGMNVVEDTMPSINPSDKDQNKMQAIKDTKPEKLENTSALQSQPTEDFSNRSASSSDWTDEREAMQREIDCLKQRNQDLEKENKALKNGKTNGMKKQPRKLESRTGRKDLSPPADVKARAQPRKLETRST